MNRWEYKKDYVTFSSTVIDINDNPIPPKPIQEQLNEYGQEGWELIQFVFTNSRHISAIAYFKRKLLE